MSRVINPDPGLNLDLINDTTAMHLASNNDEGTHMSGDRKSVV